MTLYQKIDKLVKAIEKDIIIEAEMVKKGLDYKTQTHNVTAHRNWIVAKLREVLNNEAYK